MAIDKSGRTAIFRGLTGRADADVSGKGNGSVRSMLQAAFGVQRGRPDRPDTAAAAASLGVSQRTIQRWLKAEAGTGGESNKPRGDNLKKLSAASRKAASTKAGRANAVADQKDRRSKTGGRIRIGGQQGPELGNGYSRDRTINIDVDDPAAMADFYNAYINGGEAGVRTWIRANAPQFYGVSSWDVGEIHDFEVLNLYGQD